MVRGYLHPPFPSVSCVAHWLTKAQEVKVFGLQGSWALNLGVPSAGIANGVELGCGGLQCLARLPPARSIHLSFPALPNLEYLGRIFLSDGPPMPLTSRSSCPAPPHLTPRTTLRFPPAAPSGEALRGGRPRPPRDRRGGPSQGRGGPTRALARARGAGAALRCALHAVCGYCGRDSIPVVDGRFAASYLRQQSAALFSVSASPITDFLALLIVRRANREGLA